MFPVLPPQAVEQEKNETALHGPMTGTGMTVKHRHEGTAKNDRAEEGQFRAARQQGPNDEISHQAYRDAFGLGQARGERGHVGRGGSDGGQPGGRQAGDEQQPGGDDEMPREAVAAVAQGDDDVAGKIQGGEEEKRFAAANRVSTYFSHGNFTGTSLKMLHRSTHATGANSSLRNSNW